MSQFAGMTLFDKPTKIDLLNIKYLLNTKIFNDIMHFIEYNKKEKF